MTNDPLKIGDLNKLYSSGETADSTLFSEMRSNFLLYSGEHWKNISDQVRDRLKSSTTSEAVRLKLVKNHIQAICKLYQNGIVSQAPGVEVVPYNPKELQDQKDAELCNAVWKDAEEKQSVDEKLDKWVLDFVVGGECHAKIFWNPAKGRLKGYAQKADSEGQNLYSHPDHPDIGEIPHPMVHQQQPDGSLQPLQLHPVADEAKPIFEGELEIEMVHGFNLLRDPSAESLSDAAWICIRKMVDKSDAEALLSNLPPDEQEEKIKFLQDASKTTFKVFEAQKGTYEDTKDQVMIREYYFRPCGKYPKGCFYIATETGILFEGAELPYGIFPIVSEGMDEVPTSPRYRSIVKVLRPIQANINLLCSMQIQTLITLGEDKVLTPVGARLQKGSQWAGIREFTYGGNLPPTILPGRDGNQFAGALEAEIAELYKIANVDMELKERQVQDTFAMLYSSLRQRKVYSIYAKKIERFLCNVVKLYLELAKVYLPDDYLIRAIGKREQINIPEFRRVEDDGFDIKIKPMSEDLDSMMGAQLSAQQVLQYIGKDLPKHVQGKLLKQMPFLSKDSGLDFMTTDLDCVENDMLSLERGKYPPANMTDNHELYIQMLTNRIKQADWSFLPQQVQDMYKQKLQEHTQASAEQAQQLKSMESELIPTDGALVTCSVQVDDPAKPGATKQLRVPYASLMWLVKVMTDQGNGLDQLHQMDQFNQQQVLQAGGFGQQQQQPPQQQQMPQQGPQQTGMGHGAGMPVPPHYAS